MTDCKHLLQQTIKTSEQNAVSHSATMTDRVLKLGYTSVIFVDLRVKVNGTYYCDLLLSQQLLLAICHVSSEFVL